MILAEVGPQPVVWTLAFQRSTQVPWVRWLAVGRYKHVAACRYVPDLDAWLFYDHRLYDTVVDALPAGPAATAAFAAFARDADLLTIAARPDRAEPRRVFRFAFWCVPAIKHLIGLRSGALRPDTLWRDCLRAGGNPLGRRTAVQPAGT